MEEKVLAIAEEVIGITDLAEFRLATLHALMREIPSEWASLNDLGPDPDDVAVVVIPEPPAELFKLYVEHRDENPIAAYNRRTHDGRAMRFCDLVERQELEALPLYQLVYRPMRVCYQMAFTLPTGPDRLLAIVLSREDPEYTDLERDVLNRARPLLISAFRAAIEHDALRSAAAQLDDRAELIAPLRAVGLTPREAQVARLVALGRSNRDAADELGVSDRTVAKHLERAFRKLGVRTRSQAAERVWDVLRDGGDVAAGTERPAMNAQLS
jgi:DNA-binding CsgD family transcriptional regulator